MRKFYSEPIVELRRYALNPDSVTTTSNPDPGDGDLNRDDEIDIFK